MKHAIAKLMLMINDVQGQSLFDKDGPLGWFSPNKTYTYVNSHDYLNEKQIMLIKKVFDRYKLYKEVSAEFVATNQAKVIASVMHSQLPKKPKAVTKAERSYNYKYSGLIHTFHDGFMIHIGHFNRAERFIGQFPNLGNEEKIAIWDKIHSARRCYRSILFSKQYPELSIEEESGDGSTTLSS